MKSLFTLCFTLFMMCCLPGCAVDAGTPPETVPETATTEQSVTIRYILLHKDGPPTVEIAKETLKLDLPPDATPEMRVKALTQSNSAMTGSSLVLYYWPNYQFNGEWSIIVVRGVGSADLTDIDELGFGIVGDPATFPWWFEGQPQPAYLQIHSLFNHNAVNGAKRCVLFGDQGQWWWYPNSTWSSYYGLPWYNSDTLTTGMRSQALACIED